MGGLPAQVGHALDLLQQIGCARRSLTQRMGLIVARGQQGGHHHRSQPSSSALGGHVLHNPRLDPFEGPGEFSPKSCPSILPRSHFSAGAIFFLLGALCKVRFNTPMIP